MSFRRINKLFSSMASYVLAVIFISILALTNMFTPSDDSDRVLMFKEVQKGHLKFTPDMHGVNLQSMENITQLERWGEKSGSLGNYSWIRTWNITKGKLEEEKTQKQHIHLFRISDWDTWTCKNCVGTHFKYDIINPDICRLVGPQQTIDLLIIIITKHGNRKFRETLRATWLTVTKRNRGPVRYVFLVGHQEEQEKLDKQIQQENNKYHDIVQGQLMDTYLNLTTKSICGLRWATTYCANAKYVMKTDDDMWIHTPNVLELLRRNKNGALIAGACAQYAKPIRSRKGEFGKFYVTLKEYPLPYYPPYVQGLGYILSMSIVGSVLETCANTPFYRFEDVYLGHCYAKLRLNITCLSGFKDNTYSYYTKYMGLRTCDLQSKKYITVHKVPLQVMNKAWRIVC